MESYKLPLEKDFFLNLASKNEIDGIFSSTHKPSQNQDNKKPDLISPDNPNQVLELGALVANDRYSTNQIIIKFKSLPAARQINSIQEEIKNSLNASVLKTTEITGAQLWKIEDFSVEEAIAKYSNDPNIEYIEPNYRVSAVGTIPNDPNFNQLWGLNNTGQTGGIPDVDIDAPEAWDIETGSKSKILVGVIDTGVDYNHPDLAANIWTNPGEIAGNGIDDDENGYVDDIHGYDFYNNDGDPFDDNSHGTHVSGTIAAVGDNKIGVTGINWNAKIVGLKFLGQDGYGDIFAGIQAIDYATKIGVQLTNNSWAGGGYSQALYDAIKTAGDAGQLFIAAASNEGSNNDIYPAYPASYDLDNIISVAATDHNDQLAGFSNYGLETVDLGAPGVNIYSTVPGDSYAAFNGTSMATPHVAGVASLLWSQDPDRTPQQVKNRILASVDPITALDGKTVSGGRLNAFRALAEAGTGTIRGVKWNDKDVDGVQDPNESGLPGWKIYLDKNNNGSFDRTTTQFDSENVPLAIPDEETITSTIEIENFTGKIADVNIALNIKHTWDKDLDVYLISPSGTKVELFTDVGEDGNNFTDTILDDQAETPINEGSPPFKGSFQPEGILAAFNNENPNGTWTLEITDDAKGDKGTLKNWSLILGIDEPYAETDANGEYALNGIEPGTYTIAEVPQEGWEQTFPSGDGTHTVEVIADEILENINFGNRSTEVGLIKGRKWEDLDGDGEQSLDEPGLEGWTIYLDQNPNDQLDDSGLSTVTDANGDYTFFDLSPGTYTVTEAMQPGWEQKFPDTGTHTVNLDLGEIVENIDFGNQALPGEIQGKKWHDLNGNGIQEEGEEGLEGWTIYLDENENGQLDDGELATETDDDGDYSFTGLKRGIYTVGEVMQEGWQQTYPSGSNGEKDALVFMDGQPWGSDALLQQLDSNGIEKTVVNSSEMDNIDLSEYDVVFISSDQPQNFYSNYNANAATFADYVAGGGTLWVGAASVGWNGGDFSGSQLPKGVTITNFLESFNYVTDTSSPLMAGVPNPFFGGSASHAAFVNVPEDAQVIAKGQFSNLPTLLEYDYGAGEVLAFGQTLEFGYAYNQDAGKILQNGVPYVFENIGIPGTHKVKVNPGQTVADVNFGNLSDEQVIIPDISIDDVTLIEGDSGTTNAVFTVSLSEASNVKVTVEYATADNSALAGDDYTQTSGILNFNPGQISKQIQVPIAGDVLFEPDESFFVNLSNATNGEISDDQGMATINNDDLPGSIPLPFDLFDSDGYRWDIWGNGSIGDGSNDAYDGGLYHNGFPDFVKGVMEDNDREVAIGNANLGDISVTRKVYVPNNQAFARFLEIVTNNGATATNYTVNLNTNLGSDYGTVVVNTSSNDTNFTTNDNWIVTDDIDAGGDPTMLHVIAGEGAARPSTVFTQSDSLNYTYDLTLQPGETKIVMHFASQNVDRATALTKASQLTDLGLDALAGMSEEELQQVVNFATQEDDDPDGNPGNDSLVGTSGHDTLYGGAGFDTLKGLKGHDLLDGGSDHDYLDGGDDHDTLKGGDGHDTLKGSQGNDTLYGGADDDSLDGGSGNDWLDGGNGDDTLKGGEGKNTLKGGHGDDLLKGGSGADTLVGVDTSDVMPGQGELDTLTGEEGADRYILGDAIQGAYYNDGNPNNSGASDFALIKGFKLSEDFIQLAGNASDYVLSTSGSNTNIYLDNDGIPGFSNKDELIARISGVKGLDLDESYFLFS